MNLVNQGATALKNAMLAAGVHSRIRSGVRVLSYHVFPQPAEFARHLDVLQSNCHLIGEPEFLQLLDGVREWPSDHLEVLVTADDGYECQFDETYNSLFVERGVRPIVFLIEAAVQTCLKDAHPRLEIDELGRRRPLVSRASLEAGLAAGWTVGGHTSTHVNAAQLSKSQLLDELAGSATRLEKSLGIQISTFAWPWGKLRDTTDDAMSIVSQRFAAAFSTVGGRLKGPPGNRHFLPRDVVDENMTARQLRGLLGGGLDYVRRLRSSEGLA